MAKATCVKSKVSLFFFIRFFYSLGLASFTLERVNSFVSWALSNPKAALHCTWQGTTEQSLGKQLFQPWGDQHCPLIRGWARTTQPDCARVPDLHPCSLWFGVARYWQGGGCKYYTAMNQHTQDNGCSRADTKEVMHPMPFIGDLKTDKTHVWGPKPK